MSTVATTSSSALPRHDSFRHEALLYDGLDGFIAGTTPFIQDAVAADEPILVVVGREKIGLLREALGSDADRVDFADMSSVGSNPARIIPAWYDFVAERATGGRHIRGIGEPISVDRSPQALVECQRHESLLNLAFCEASAWWLLCPYDTTDLHPAVIEEAFRSHPFILEDGDHRSSETYSDLPTFAKPFDLPLSDPHSDITTLPFDLSRLDAVRRLVWDYATGSGLPYQRAQDFVVAVNEVATNSLRHGGGQGELRCWIDGKTLVCEVMDGGLLDKPLVGRRRPEPGQEGGFGVWLVHQLCDLVQMRTFQEGNVVRMHMSLP